MSEPDAFARIVRALNDQEVRFVVIGVSGANYYAPSAAALFKTFDRDLFMPRDVDNLVAAWRVCENAGLYLLAGAEALDVPRDRQLAAAVVERSALTRATDGAGLDLDLTLVMAGFEFDTVWQERRRFRVDGVEIPVARLEHIVESKARTGRPKDRLFLEAHREALRQMLGEGDD